MNIWNKVFLVLIFLLAGAVVFFVSQEMKIRKEWGEAMHKLEKRIQDEVRKMTTAIEGTAPDKPVAEKSIDEMSYAEVVLQLRDFVYERGNNAWFACQPGTVTVDGKSLTPKQLGGESPATPGDRLKAIQLVEVKLSVTGPIVDRDGKEEVVPPTDLKGIVYLFVEGGEDSSGAFLGRFTVIQVQGLQVTLQAANALNEVEVQLIEKSRRGSWALYSTVPKDRYHGLLDRLSPDEIDRFFTPAQQKLLLEPERTLKDFDELLTRLYQWRTVLQQDIDRSKRDIDRLDKSLEIAADQGKGLQTDIDFEKKRIRAMSDQVDGVRKKVDEYDALITDLKEKIDVTQQQNEWFVAKIAEYQLKVSRLIEQRAQEAVE